MPNFNRLSLYLFWAVVAIIAFLIGFTLFVAIADPQPGPLLILLIADAFCLSMGGWMIVSMYKEGIVKIGVVERVLERRKIAAAAATAERYSGMNLIETPEAKTLPVPRYVCANEGCVGYARNEANDMYWVEVQPLLPEGWYCGECVGKMPDKPKGDRLNMEVFLILLDSDPSERVK